ncbi:MAG: hypothetical protein KDH96_10005 [Candidatus Riesia sp.]|nr:hypothetical protein [Candidatus Riesia sp.]
MHDKTGNPVNNAILQLFDEQRHRGLQGFGLATVYPDNVVNIVRKTTEEGILKYLVKHENNIMLFHHRNPTSTVNVKRAAHPFSTKDTFGDNQYILIHNGHITNSRAMKKEHEEKFGIEYQSVLQDGTFNDSESLLWDLALVLEGHKDSLEVYGGIAFICMKVVKGELERIYFGRNSNPLKMVRDKDTLRLSSEGTGDDIEKDTLYNFNFKSNRLTHRYFKIKEWYTSYNWEETKQRYTGQPQNYTYLHEEDDDIIGYDDYGMPIYYFDRIPLVERDKVKKDANALVTEYMKINNNNVERVYWCIEADYDVLWTYYSDNDPETRHDMYVLEEAMSIVNLMEDGQELVLPLGA